MAIRKFLKGWGENRGEIIANLQLAGIIDDNEFDILMFGKLDDGNIYTLNESNTDITGIYGFETDFS